MRRWIRTSAYFLTAALCWCAGAQRAIAAGPLDDRVPQDALAYIGWAGADSLQEQYAHSNLKGVLDASVLQKFVADQAGKLIGNAKSNPNMLGPDGLKIMDRLQSALPILWRHPTAVYFCPLDLTNPQQPVIRAGAICDAGAEAKDLSDTLKAALVETPPPASFPIRVLTDGNVVILAMGPSQTAADMKKGGGLAGNAAYKAAMAKVALPTPALALYADAAGALAMAKDAMAKTNAPADVQKKAAMILDATGISSFSQIALASGFSPGPAAGTFGWTDKSFVGITGPRQGLLAVLDSQPLSDAAMAMIPRDATMFSAFKLDPAKILGELRNVLAKVEPGAQKDLESSLDQAKQALNVDLDKELISAMGDEWVFYRGPISEEGGNSYALVHKLRQGEVFAKSLASLEKTFNEHVNAVPGLNMFKAEKMTTSKIEVSTIALGGFSVAWTARNGYLYISTMDGIAGAVKQVENKAPGVAENDMYKAARATLPAGAKPMVITYANPAKVYPELRRMAMGYLPVLRQFDIDIPRELFPDPADVAKFLTPSADIAWWEADGLHQMGNSAFPGAELMTGQQVMPGIVLTLGVLGFAVPRAAMAGEEASLTVDAVNLRAIGQSCMVYAADHKDQMPDDLARLVAEGMLAPRQLVSRRNGSVALELTPELQKMGKDDFAKFSEQVAQHTDFVYLGKGTKMDGGNASIILAFEKPGPQTRDGINIIFRDLHVAFMRWVDLADVFNATNEYLKQNNQPTIDLKEQMKKAGVEG